MRGRAPSTVAHMLTHFNTPAVGAPLRDLICPSGVPTAVVKSDESLPMDATVKSVLADGDHVSVQHSLGRGRLVCTSHAAR